MMIRRLLIAAVFGALMLPLVAGHAAGQERRTLFEVLFGNQNQQQQTAPSQQQQTTPQPRAPQPSAPRPQAPPPAPPQPAASAPPVPEEQDKAEEAMRITVFGDSMAVDLAAGLDRFYTEDAETLILGEGVGSSGFVRNDYFDWQDALEDAIARDSFDIAVVIAGINDRQALDGAAPLSESWKSAYSARIERFVETLQAGGKPFVWIELPPMEQSGFSTDMAQISALHRAAVQAAGGGWVETYERYMSEAGNYTAVGPDLNGNIVSMRKGDGIHFSDAGADKLAFYIDRAIRPHHSGGGITVEVADLLEGTDAAEMLRPPFQGLDQVGMFETAGLVQQIGGEARRAQDLVFAGAQSAALAGFDLDTLLAAPPGRVDAFGAVPPETGAGNRAGR